MIYKISNKTLIGPEPFDIKFDKTDGSIRIYDETIHLRWYGSEKFDTIYNKIKCFINLKSSITFVFSHYYTKIKVDFYDSLPIKKRLTVHNVIILIKWVLSKDQNHY